MNTIKKVQQMNWKKYRKKGTTEMREVTVDEVCTGKLPDYVSVSDADKKNR